MAGKKRSKVREQYEEYPYPHRDPKDEKKRLITGSPSQLPEMVHYLFKGQLPKNAPMRVLVAGGGTGDALMMLAQQLSDAGVKADIHYIDLSSASRKIAEKRARIRGLEKIITFHSGSLLDAAELGPFDYIDCCGVLHHLPNPGEGFRALKTALAPQGGMGIMVYGEVGRTGIYHAQEMLRMVAGDGPSEARVKLARRLVDELPETNWLQRNVQIGDHRESDAGLFDLLLHSQDRAYTVPQLVEVTAAAGLEIVSFIDPARYDPTRLVKDKEVKERLSTLDSVQQASFAELYSGNIRKHILYLTHAEREDNTIAAVATPQMVPRFKDLPTQAMLHQMPQGAQPSVESDGLHMQLSLPPHTAVIMRAIDGSRNLEEIRKLMPGPPNWDDFVIVFQAVFESLNGVGMLFYCDFTD